MIPKTITQFRSILMNHIGKKAFYNTTVTSSSIVIKEVNADAFWIQGEHVNRWIEFSNISYWGFTLTGDRLKSTKYNHKREPLYSIIIT
jgi:hypothetical protein